MDDFKTNSELKQDARKMLEGRWKDAVLMNLIPALLGIASLVLLVIGIASFSVVTNDSYVTEELYENMEYSDDTHYEDDEYYSDVDETFEDSTGNGGSFAGDIFTAVITTGMSFAFLTAFRDPSYQIRPLRDVFQVFSKKYFLGVLIIFVVSNLFTLLWMILFIIPGIVKSYSYSQAFLIYKDYADHPGTEKISAIDCITESRELMDGHKGRLFALDVSFIGWYLLGFLTLGIGFLWITPYTTAARTAFYNDLTTKPPLGIEPYSIEWEDEDWED